MKEKLENVENFCETPLLCAARFANGLIGDLEAQGILSSIDGIEIKNSDNPNRNNLRNLSLCIPKAVFNPYFASFRQGYILAKYVRKNLNIKDFVVDICSIYAFLGVEIKKIKFPKKLHAVAVWFDLEIAVFVNSDLFDERNKRLFNTTLAHELAHILVDRGNALPIADIVLSDTIKSEIEQRARAFAAEFLLPQSLVGHPENRTAKNVLEIAEKYGVGDILAAYQIRNAHKSEIYVSDTLLEEAQSLIQKYEAGEGLYNFQ
ncbi:MAG: ImmA/IrrE family metallo-endopeptidase [Desulfovibrionaceae bacterium]|nr:ImmA/IrrE family metallo-endopeptidase [Desulfovibrionaceae bacterium]